MGAGTRVATPPGGFRHIAVLRLSSLGDVILTLPVVHALAGAWPDARLTYWTKEEYRDVVRFDRRVSHVRVLEKDARRVEDLVSMSAELEGCDLIVDLHGSARTRLLTFRQKAPVLRAPSLRLERERWVRARWTRPGPVSHVLERYAEAIRPLGLTAPGTPGVEAGADAEAWAESWMAGWNLDRPPVALCPGAGHFTKRWPEERWAHLIARLRAERQAVLLFSLDRERRAVPGLDRAAADDPLVRWSTEPLPRMAALLSRCSTAVANDSGLMHLAAARGLRVVAIFGSTAPELGFAPAGEGHVVVCRHEPCQPCTLHGRPACPKGHFNCMRLIAPEEIAASAIAVASGARS